MCLAKSSQEFTTTLSPPTKSEGGSKIVKEQIITNRAKIAKNKNKMQYQQCDDIEDTDSRTSLTNIDSDDSHIGVDTRSSTSPSSSNNNKSVRFSTITIREYQRCIGEDTVTSCGPPISLVWNHDNETSFDVDEYEDAYCETQRRSQAELKMPSSYRSAILLELGYSRTELQQINLKLNKVREQRSQTVNGLRWKHNNIMVPVQQFFSSRKRMFTSK
jgi:hypothetical protein